MSNGCFYFTRHGQTIWNVENKICGATDIALTDLGHQQAIDLGSKIAQEDLGIDEILYSPLMRAADTAKHISQMTGIPARMEPRLKEQNFEKSDGSVPRFPYFCKVICILSASRQTLWKTCEKG